MIYSLNHLSDKHMEDIIESLHQADAKDTAYFVEVQASAILAKDNVDERLEQENLI